MAPNSYIIVGSGVFGASTALHLIRKYPTALITLVDRDAPDAATRVAASWDWNKVIRADYRSAFYAKLALEAQHLWRTDTVWQPFYHETGIVWISPTTFGEQAFRNFVELGADVDMKLYPVKEARAMYGGIFDDADYSGVKEVLVNRSSGWAEAKEALQSTIEAAVGLGVKYVMAEVAVLEFEECDGRRRCCGVRTAQGERIVGENVVLSTGAFTAKLLVDSAPAWVDLHAGDRMVATAATEAIAPLKTDQASMLRNMPVGINDNPTERGYDVGCLPLPKYNAFKFWGQTLLRNTIEHPITKTPLSMPPAKADYDQWNVPSALKDDVEWAHKSLLGKMNIRHDLKHVRICWDALTPSEDFIISPHSACDGLFVATCGSFHGFKFLPVLGKYVVDMLDGELNPSLQQRWAWNRELPPNDPTVKKTYGELVDFISERTSY